MEHMNGYSTQVASDIHAHVLDVTSDNSVARCLREVGPLDAIVNNAGLFGIEAKETHKGPADYAGLWEQWAGANSKMTGPSLPGPEVVALAIASAIDDPATPLRVPVGRDAEMILGLRRSLDDQAFEEAMRKAVGLTW
jgi:hypothetical protein